MSNYLRVSNQHLVTPRAETLATENSNYNAFVLPRPNYPIGKVQSVTYRAQTVEKPPWTQRDPSNSPSIY